MKTKYQLVLLLMLGISTNAFSCLMASQERIIPLGTSENCLIGLEVIAYRYGEGEYGQNVVWDYEFTLKGFPVLHHGKGFDYFQMNTK